MDIRHFFKKARLEESQGHCSSQVTAEKSVEKSTENIEPIPEDSANTSHIFDIGNFLESDPVLSKETRFKALTQPWTPNKNYNFKNDSSGPRAFRHQWLSEYPCISYSQLKKGILCRSCVLFKPHVDRGFQSSFILKEFTKYKDFHSSIKHHITSKWHCESSESANNFLQIMEHQKLDVVQQIDASVHKVIESNRQKLMPIIKTIVFCGTHGLPLRGKDDEHGVFKNLLDFRIDAGDSILKNHLETCTQNSKYTSHRIQNEIINTCGDILREHIMHDINNSAFFSVIADESADISGVEQLAIAIRFVDKNTVGYCIREEFLGFVPLESMDAKTVSNKILSSLRQFGLNSSKMVGQGYDGCSVMAGKINGVQKLIQEQYPMASFFHCASHKLNLVVNDLNNVQEIRNTAASIKEIIRFFRESPLRRQCIPNIPLFCETRWTAKYKSIRIFQEHFCSIVDALQHMSVEGSNINTRQRALQLYYVCASSNFIICLHVMAHYSALLEPVANILQGTEQNIFSVKTQITSIKTVFQEHRENAEENFHSIMKIIEKNVQQLNIEIKLPRLANNQKNRTNVPCDSTESYYRRSVFIPYIDSLLLSLSERFSDDNDSAFSLFQLHPNNMRVLTKTEYEATIKHIHIKYGCFLENFSADATVWFTYWKDKPIKEIENLNFLDLLQHSSLFYPSVFLAITLALSLPTTSCTVERSFSTLRRVKTWLRSTMVGNRLDGFCMMTVHRDIISNMKEEYFIRILNRFALEKRRLQFLFSD